MHDRKIDSAELFKKAEAVFNKKHDDPPMFPCTARGVLAGLVCTALMYFFAFRMFEFRDVEGYESIIVAMVFILPLLVGYGCALLVNTLIADKKRTGRYFDPEDWNLKESLSGVSTERWFCILAGLCIPAVVAGWAYYQEDGVIALFLGIAVFAATSPLLMMGVMPRGE